MLQICTIIARNYLPQALVLARSLRETDPDARFTVLLVDDETRAVDGRRLPFTCLRLGELALDEREMHRLATMYDVTELATSVKPLLLQYLLREPGATAVYLDPDIVAYDSLAPLVPLAEAHGIVLTPHTTVPLPRDDRRLAASDLLAAGVFNLGFIAVTQRASDFLHWWWRQTCRDALSDISRMMFTDQRWIDFVPCLYDHVILKDPAYNVAYWNLHGRQLAWQDGRYTVDGRRLRFFHFSGFDPRRPWILSKHQGDAPRVVLSEHPAVARICREYAEALEAARDPELESLPYGWAAAGAGFPLNRRMRHMYREALLDAERSEGPEPPTAFDPDPTAFVRFLNTPVAPAANPKVSRYLYALHQERPDLREHFPNLASDGEAFLNWVLGDGVRQDGIPGPLLPTPEQVRAASSPAPAFESSSGVNVVGYFNAELGVGEAGRLLVRALESSGIDYATVSYRNTRSRQQHVFDDHGLEQARYGTNVLCVNADQTPGLVGELGRSFFASRHNVGYWFWEVERFPENMHQGFALVDEVWVATRFVAEAVRAAGARPVEVVPLPIAVPAPPSHVARAELGIPDRFAFFFMFDFFSVVERKNPMALIEAFSRAFGPEEGPVLVLKSINGQHRRNDLERVRMLVGDRTDIILLDDYVPQDRRTALLHACDCYVSLHRSEGLGLTMAEAMALGKPVIATGYSGNLDFMTPENSFLVDYALGTVPAGCEPYPVGTPWAEANVEHAAALMRRVYERPEEAARRGLLAREQVLERFSPAACGSRVARRLEEIGQTRRSRSSTSMPAPAFQPRAPIEQALAAARDGARPSVQVRGPLGFVRAAYQQVLYRLLRPFWFQHGHAHDQLITAMERMHAALAEQRAEQQAIGRDLKALDATVERGAETWRARLEQVDAERAEGQTALGERVAALDARIEVACAEVTAIEAPVRRLAESAGRDREALRTASSSLGATLATVEATQRADLSALAARLKEELSALRRELARLTEDSASLEESVRHQASTLAAHLQARQAEMASLNARIEYELSPRAAQGDA